MKCKLNYNINIIFLFLFLFTINIFSQQNTGAIIGRVVSSMTQNPLPGITVRVLGTNLGTYTNNDGKFNLRNIPVGIYAIQFSGIGYNTFVQANVSINSAKPTDLEVELIEKIIELKGAEVRSSYFNKRIETVTSTQTFNIEDIRRAPGVQEDVIRATALLPGVGVTSAGRNDLLVRGGAPFENLFVVDNIEIPNINHFGSQGSTGGPLSLINIDFVKNVNFSAGGFGARYGDKLSSITNITLRSGNEEKLGGKLVLSATGFGANIEGPISKNATFWFSARRSYLDFIFKAAGFGFIPQYWDFQGKFDYEISKDDRISFITIGALDDVKLNNETLDQKFSNSRVAVPNLKQYFSGITWKHLTGSGFLTITLGETLTDFNTFQNDSNLVEIFKNKSREAETSLKTDGDFQIYKNLLLTFGNQVKMATTLRYDILIPGYMRTDNSGIPRELKVDTTFTTYKNSTYANITTSVGDLKITAGGRLDYYNFTIDKLYISPRLSLIYQINPVSAVIFSSGIYYQSPSPIWLIGDANQKLNAIKAHQVVLGYEHTPMEDLKVQVEGYYKWYDKYPARKFRPQAVLAPSGFDDISNDIPYGLEPLVMEANGFSRGVELFIQKKLSEIPLYGLLSISLSESKFTSLDGKERYGNYDSRIITNFSLGYRFDENWELSGKFRLATGTPTTPYLPNGQKDYYLYNEGERLPLFHSLDLRLDKRWGFEKFFLITYIDIQNVYNRKNVSNIRWNPRTQQVEYPSNIGILPSIGVNFEF